MRPLSHLLTRTLPILLGLVLLGLGVVVERLNDERHALAVRAEVQGRLTELRDRINGQLLSDLQLVRGLISVINLEPGLTQARFEQAVLPLLAGNTHLRNVGAAPDMVIRMMVPIQGNERAIGLDYRRTPAQFEAAERARVTRQVVLAGPLPLVQGGNGLVARLPVFLREPDGERFWGLVSAVIDSDRLFQSVGARSPGLSFELAIRGTDGLGAAGAPSWGARRCSGSSRCWPRSRCRRAPGSWLPCRMAAGRGMPTRCGRCAAATRCWRCWCWARSW